MLNSYVKGTLTMSSDDALRAARWLDWRLKEPAWTPDPAHVKVDEAIRALAAQVLEIFRLDLQVQAWCEPTA